MKSYILIAPILIAAILILASTKAIAQDTLAKDNNEVIKEIIVVYQADKDNPISFQNINAATLKEKSTGEEPSFLLAETPAISNYSDAGSGYGYSYYRMRGMDQTRINTTLDGMPMNEPEDQGAYFSNYPDILNSVSKIQIQRGVGTSKNGVASYAGSIQLYSPNLAANAEKTIGLTYGSFNTLRAFAIYNSGIKNNKALYIRASKTYSDGYKHHANNNGQSIFVSAGFYKSKSIWKINLLAGHQRNNMAWLGVSDSLIQIDRKTNANTAAEKDKFSQVLAQVNHSFFVDKNSSIHSSIYYTFLNGNYDLDINNFLGLASSNELFNYALQSHFVGVFSNYNYTKNKFNFTAGIHANAYNRRHIGRETLLGEVYRNKGYKNEISTFVKGNYTIAVFNLFADIQYRYAYFDYKGSVAMKALNWHFVNPKVGISTNINKHALLYYSLGYTGREATRNDIFGGNDDLLADSAGKAILFNTQPEYVLNHELGLRAEKEKISFNINAYFMDFKHELVLAGQFGPNGLALTNKVEKSFRTGIELNAMYKAGKYIYIEHNSAYNYSRIKESGESFRPILSPSLIINQSIIFNKNNFQIALSARYQSASFIDFANTAKIKAYYLLNLRASYSINKFKVSAFVNNLNNAKYYNYAYVDFDGSKKYFVQAGINFYLSLQYSF